MSTDYNDYRMMSDKEKLDILGDIYRRTACDGTKAIVLEETAKIYRRQKRGDSKESTMRHVFSEQ